MSASEFPLKFVLQIQNEMGVGVNSASGQLTQLQQAADGAANATQNVETRVKSANTNFLSLGLGIASAAGGVVNLIRQYHNLQKAQRTVQSLQGSEENSLINLKRKRDAYAKAVKEHGENSEEAVKAQDDLTKAENGLLRIQNRLTSAQVSLNDRMLDFAFSIVPSVVGVVAGLAQTFQITGQSMGGGRGFLGILGKFFVPLAILGGVLFAIKTNFLGFRDVLNQVGVAIGNAIPQLVPFLDALNNLGIVLGIVPGNAQLAQDALKEFGGVIVQWGKDVFSTVSKVIKQFTSGDFLGAFKTIKGSVKAVIDIVVGIGKTIWTSKIPGGITMEQWVHALPVLFNNELKKENGNVIQAGINVFTDIVDIAIRSILPEAYEKLYTNFANKFDATKGANLAPVIINAAVDVGIWIIGKDTLANMKAAWDHFIAGNPRVKMEAIIDVVVGTGNFFLGLINWIPGIKQLTAEWDRTKGQNMVPIAVDFFVSVGKFVWDAAIDLSAAATELLNSLYTAVKKKWDELGGLGGLLGKLMEGAAALFSPVSLTIPSLTVQPKVIHIADIPGGKDSISPLASEAEMLRMSVPSITVVPQMVNVDYSQSNTSLGTFDTTKLLQIGIQAETTKQSVIRSMEQMVAAVNQQFVHMANHASIIFNSMGANAQSGKQQVINAMSEVFTNVSAGMTGLANTWSAINNSFGANARSGASQVISALNSMASRAKSLFNQLGSMWSKVMSAMASATKKAVNSIISDLNRIPKKIVTIHEIREVHTGGRAKGGLMSFAEGGMMSAARGRMFTAFGPQQVLVGDNPGGKETVAFIPHNDPGPTLEKIARMFGSVALGHSVSASGVSSSGIGGITINNEIFLDGQKIEGVIQRSVKKNSANFR